MNDTITRIVNLLFEDVVVNEETTAMREEILYNCQERFNDLVAGGVDADTATAAIVESLKGMEDVLSQYEKKPADEQAFEGVDFEAAEDAAAHTKAFQKEETAAQEETTSDEASYVFPAMQVSTVSVGLVDDDVELSVSNDGQIHVLCEENPENLRVRLDGDTLRIDRNPLEFEQPKDGFHVEVSASNLGEFFEKLFGNFTRKLANSVSQITKSMKVTVLLPRESDIRVQLSTTSGNVNLNDLRLGNCQLTTTSGDVNISHCVMSELRTTTTSGDLDTEDAKIMGSLQLVSTSGDIDWQGSCGQASVNTVSGDMKLEGKIDSLHLRTVSGDAEVNALDGIQRIEGKSTSGDFSFILPANMQVEPHFRTLSGSMHIHHHEGSGSETVRINVQTVSGDISTY